jgi:hypothetical protein
VAALETLASLHFLKKHGCTKLKLVACGSKMRPLSTGTRSSACWYQGKAEITSFGLDEIFGTKLRALLQRNKGRDLLDLYHGLDQLSLDTDRLIASDRPSMPFIAAIENNANAILGAGIYWLHFFKAGATT